MSLINRIKKLEAIRNKPLTEKEMNEMVEWAFKNWLPYDEEASKVIDEMNDYAQSKGYPFDTVEQVLHWTDKDKTLAELERRLDDCFVAYHKDAAG